MIIKNARIFQEQGGFIEGDIYIEQDRIVPGPVTSELEVLDADGSYAIPGLTDLHFHGCAGYDFCDGTREAFEAIAHYEAMNGITQICPATMTLPEEKLASICTNAATYQNKRGAILCGINMEGPFLSIKKKGAQNERYLRKPDRAMFQRLDEQSNRLIKILCIAPEEEEALDLITAYKGKKVISVAHTNADYSLAMEAFQRGAGLVTHLFNAMPPLHHREPGVIGAAFDSPECSVELICDGYHLHPSIVRAAVKLFGEDRIIFVSDSMMATGFAEGNFYLGGQEVRVAGNKAVLSDGTLAGSVTNLMDCMRNAVINMGISLHTAIRAAAVNPAKLIGIYDHYGSIAPGKIANIVLLDDNLRLKSVILKGKIYSD